MPRLAVVLAAGLLGLLGLLGCRGHTVSTREFLTRGNAACAAAAKRIRDLTAPLTTPTAGPEQFAGYVDDYVAEMRLALTNLRSIGYPAGQRPHLEGDYRELESQLATAERNPLGFRPAMLAPSELALRRDGLSGCQA